MTFLCQRFAEFLVGSLFLAMMITIFAICMCLCIGTLFAVIVGIGSFGTVTTELQGKQYVRIHQ